MVLVLSNKYGIVTKGQFWSEECIGYYDNACSVFKREMENKNGPDDVMLQDEFLDIAKPEYVKTESGKRMSDSLESATNKKSKKGA
jgi:hypothetical protein